MELTCKLVFISAFQYILHFRNTNDQISTDDSIVDAVFEHIHTCSEHAYCTDTIGSYTCECKPGFKNELPPPDLGKKCTDIDECDPLQSMTLYR